eukprot:1558640-Alexandrium_andersonii.AAC.1
MHPSGASGTNFEAVPGLAQFKLRTPQTMLHVRQFKLRRLVIWSLQKARAGRRWLRRASPANMYARSRVVLYTCTAT